MGRKLTEQERILLSLSTYSEFENVLNDMFISERQRQICYKYYFEKKTFLQIADEVNYSEVTVSREIRDFAKKLGKYIKEKSM